MIWDLVKDLAKRFFMIVFGKDKSKYVRYFDGSKWVYCRVEGDEYVSLSDARRFPKEIKGGE